MTPTEPEITAADEAAFAGEQPACGEENLGMWFCNRAVGHDGDHAELTDDDRAGMDEADDDAICVVGYFWPVAS